MDITPIEKKTRGLSSQEVELNGEIADIQTEIQSVQDQANAEIQTLQQRANEKYTELVGVQRSRRDMDELLAEIKSALGDKPTRRRGVKS